jgi:surface antigen
MNRHKRWEQSKRPFEKRVVKTMQLPSRDSIEHSTQKTLFDYSLMGNMEAVSQFKRPHTQATRDRERPPGQLLHRSTISNVEGSIIFAPTIALPTQRDVETTPSQHSIAPGSLASYYSMEAFVDKRRAHLSAVLSHPVTPLWREYYSEASFVSQAQRSVNVLPISLTTQVDGQEVAGMRPMRPAKRNMIIWGTILLLVAFLFFSMSVVFSPIEQGSGAQGFVFLQPLTAMLTPVSKRSSLQKIQAATATAVTQDGYDTGGSKVFAGVPTAPVNQRQTAVDKNGLDRFLYGQCTYWANMRYHQLTGHWVPWVGSAYQWAYQAPVAGWRIGDRPNPHGPSILVLAPHAQGAGVYGHVGVVERVNRDGSVIVSSWNWKGAWGKKSRETFHVGEGVSFIWYG